MSMDKIASLMVMLLLIEMMMAVGHGASRKDLARVVTDYRLIPGQRWPNTFWSLL